MPPTMVWLWTYYGFMLHYMSGLPQGCAYHEVSLKGLMWAEPQNRHAAQHTYSLIKNEQLI